jgi:hypothetical protein
MTLFAFDSMAGLKTSRGWTIVVERLPTETVLIPVTLFRLSEQHDEVLPVDALQVVPGDLSRDLGVRDLLSRSP